MTNDADVPTGGASGADATISDVVRKIARWGLSIGGAALLAGLAARVAGWSEVSRICLLGGLGAIVALPVVNVLAEMVQELRRREWVFFAAAVAVLAILVYNVVRVF